ncbi:hypothetical protein SUGI_0427860 [Cryptomeria japonica]|nr:hypothetical protein SUGI_0427860 [Cryptomeria japonica]
MAVCSIRNQNVVEFLKEKGLDDTSISKMITKCRRLEVANVEERAKPNWNYLQEIGIPSRKLPSIVLSKRNSVR